MKHFIFILFICTFFIANPTYAIDLEGNIKGKIIDAGSKKAMEFVTISVKRKDIANAPLKGSITDKDGVFVLGNLADGEYTLTVSFMGYATHQQDFIINASNPNINIPAIILKEDSSMLEEVQVVGTRSQMKFEIDKKVFNVDQSIVSAGGAASDVLSNIPSVEVDNEGEISLRGSSSVTVWINGKASGLTADNRAQILEQLPAESIEKIEVITNPSAKYSPEGTAGIINIVLKQNRQAGYYGSVQAGADTRGSSNASANINYNIGKWDMYASIGYRDRHGKSGGHTNRLYTNISDTTYQYQRNSGKGNGGHYNARLGATYHLTSSDHFSVSGFGMFGSRNNKNHIYYTSNVPNSFLSSHRYTKSDRDMDGGNIEIGYKHDFSKTSNLDFTASYNIWNMDGKSVYNQTSLYPSDRESASYQRQNSEVESKNWEVQLDYMNAFNKNNKIEAGYKGTFSREESPVETYSGSTAANATPTEELFNDFYYDKDIHALYVTYSGRLDKLGIQLGLRGEYSDISTRSTGYDENKSDVRPYTKDYFSFFPSVFLSYQLPKDNEIQVNYTRRISRPWGGQLNPFINISDSTNISFGNPYLDPQYSNAFEVNYIKNWDNHTISFSGYYRTTDDVIQRIRYMEDNIMKTTWENITKNESAGAEFVVKNKFFKRLDLTTTLNMYYYKLDGFSYLPAGSDTPVIGESDDDFSWNVRMIANLSLPKFYSLQVTGNYRGKQNIAQGYRKSNYSLDAGIRKSFNKLSVNINARDLLDSRKWNTVTHGDGFRQSAKSWWGGRQVGITLTYSFGNMKAKRTPQKKQQNGQSGYDVENGEF